MGLYTATANRLKPGTSRLSVHGLISTGPQKLILSKSNVKLVTQYLWYKILIILESEEGRFTSLVWVGLSCKLGPQSEYLSFIPNANFDVNEFFTRV